MAWIIRRARPFDRTPDSIREKRSLAQCGGVVVKVGFESLGLLALRFGRGVLAAGPAGSVCES